MVRVNIPVIVTGYIMTRILLTHPSLVIVQSTPLYRWQKRRYWKPAVKEVINNKEKIYLGISGGIWGAVNGGAVWGEGGCNGLYYDENTAHQKFKGE